MKRTFIILILIFAFVELNAQYGSFGILDAKSNGMGGCANASATGLLSLGKNPAMLNTAMDSVASFIFMLPDFSFQLHNNSLSLKDFTHYFGNKEAKYLTDAERDDLLGFFKDDGKMYYSISAIPFAMSYSPSKEIGTFSFAISEVVAGNLVIAKDLIDLTLSGNDSGKVYSFDDSDLKTWWLRSYNLSYARKIYEEENNWLESIYAGITVKFVTGYEYTSIENVNSRFHTGENNVLTGHLVANSISSFSPAFGVEYDFDKRSKTSNFNFLFMEPAGIGYGIDFGLYSELDNGLNLGLSITDIGSVNWSKETVRYDVKSDFFVDDILNKEKRDSLLNSTNTKGEYIGSFSTSMPTALRFGASFDLSQHIEDIPGILKLALDYNQGFNKMPGNSTTPHLAFGAFWYPDFDYPYFMTGVSHSQTGKINLTLGAGYIYKFFKVNISTYDVLSLLSSKSSSPNYSFGLNLLWRIM